MKYFATKIIHLILYLILLTVTFPSYGKKSAVTPVDSLTKVLVSDPDNVMALRKLSLYALNGNNDSLSTVYGNRLLAIANTKHDDEAATYGKMILGQTALMQNKKQEAYRYLYDARHLAEHHNDSLSLASIFNGMGIYSYYYSYDLTNALTYYFKGLECAKAAHDDGLYYKLLNNIANAYLERNDTTGIEYARECYDYAREVKDYRLLFSSALCLAEAYYKQHDYTRAFLFLAEVEKILPELKDKNIGQYYEVKGKVQAAIGLIEKAAESFELGKQAWRNYPSRYLRMLVSQAEFEYCCENFAKSKEILDSVMMLSSDSVNTRERLDAMWMYSYIHEHQGNLAEALNKSREFSKLKSTTYFLANARMLNEAKANYEFDRISGQLARQKLMSVKHQRNFYVAAAVAILLIVIIVSFFIYHLRMKKIHSVIVGNMRNSLKSEDVLKSRIRELEADLANTVEAPQKSAVVQDTLAEIMNDIETLFDKDRVYTDPGLTRDSLADILGTNSTYITRAISERYHVSFVQFVNNYRIKEAVRIISDPDDDTPIKAVGINVGYNSPTSFYNHFKEATGMTPAAYREAAKRSDNRAEESE